MLLEPYGSLQKLLQQNTDLLSTLNTNAPRNYWKDQSHQRAFLESLASSKGLSVPDQLDQISRNEIVQSGGRQLLRQHPSLYSMCKALYPDFPWTLSSFARTPRGSWDSTSNQKEFFDQMIQELQLPSPLSLAEISTTEVKERGGRSIMDKYPSYYSLLRKLYPEQDWSIARQRIPRGHWGESANVAEFVEAVRQTYAIKTKEDWYRVSLNQLGEITGGDRLLRLFGGLGAILAEVYPEEHWDTLRFKKRDKRAAQRFLFVQLSRLFPAYEIIEEHNHADATRLSGQTVELDVFIPALGLAFEYHGVHHYKETTAFGPIELYLERDQEKLSLCRQCEIELVVIPYTWDGKISSLRQQIPARFLEQSEEKGFH